MGASVHRGGRSVSNAVSNARIVRPGAATTDSGQNFVREVVETVLLTLLIFFAVHFSVQPFRVDGPSMQPGLHTGEYVVVNLLTYDFTAPQRGDVIVFHPPDSPDTPYVKRIVAIPGDTVSVTADAIYVNDVKLKEPYISAMAPGQNENPNVLPPFKLDKDQYFVLGDNRINSQDSRFFSRSVTRQMIVGKAELVIWPVTSLQWIRNYSSVFAGIKR
jgi:signal peptidase I